MGVVDPAHLGHRLLVTVVAVYVHHMRVRFVRGCEDGHACPAEMRPAADAVHVTAAVVFLDDSFAARTTLGFLTLHPCLKSFRVLRGAMLILVTGLTEVVRNGALRTADAET